MTGSDTVLKPTDSSGCGLRLGDFATLTEALDYAATSRAGFNFYSARGELIEVLPYRDLREQALTLARRILRCAALRMGDRVGLVAETGGHFMRAFFACQYAGLIPVPLPTPVAFAGRASYVAHLRNLLASAAAAAVLTPAAYLKMVSQAAEPLGLKMLGTLDMLDALPEDGTDLPKIGHDHLSYLQFSSGSTRSPAGVAVTQRGLLANVRGILQALEVTAADRSTSWLPFYHDMGLVGFILAPVASQVSTDYIAAGEFARRPLTWLRLIAGNGGTISYSPSFGYELCARRAISVPPGQIDLSTWRVAGVGGDMIRPAVLVEFAAAFHGCRFRKEAFVASYGMAEATLGISFAPLGRGIEVDRIDLDLLQRADRAAPANGNEGRAREFVLCGPVLPGHEIEIRDAEGNVLEDRHVGRILFRGPSVMQGYLASGEAAERVLSSDGWLDTGDLGYLHDGSLVVTGRSKDLILVNGRNVWPQDLEWAVESQVDGLRPGDAAAFSVDETDRERIILLVQCRQSDAAARETLRRKVGEVLLATAGLACTVVLVSHNELPRTSSGKLSRVRARQMYLASLQDPSQRGAAATAPGRHPSATAD